MLKKSYTDYYFTHQVVSVVELGNKIHLINLIGVLNQFKRWMIQYSDQISRIDFVTQLH